MCQELFFEVVGKNFQAASAGCRVEFIEMLLGIAEKPY
jgi:hypothetical protein